MEGGVWRVGFLTQDEYETIKGDPLKIVERAQKHIDAINTKLETEIAERTSEKLNHEQSE